MPSTTYNEMESIMAVKKYYDEANLQSKSSKIIFSSNFYFFYKGITIAVIYDRKHFDYSLII